MTENQSRDTLFRKGWKALRGMLGLQARRRELAGLGRRARGGDLAATARLLEALTHETGPSFGPIILPALAGLAHPGTIDLLCRYWSGSRRPELERLIQERRYQASEPLWLKVLTRLKTGQLEELRAMGEAVVAPLTAARRDPDAAIRSAALAALAGLEKEAAIEALCLHLVRNADPELYQVTAERGFVPAEENQRALFFFVNGDWERYEGLDFQEGRPLLARAYRRAPEPVRRRCFETALQAGRSALLGEVLAGGGTVRRLGSMTRAEWQALVGGLRGESRWEELWQLLPLAPLEWVVELARILREAGWRPGDGQLELWQALQEGLPTVDSNWSWWFDEPIRAIRGHKAGVTALAVAPGGATLASADASGLVRLWELPAGHLLHELNGHRQRVTGLAFSPDGAKLASGDADGHLCLWHVSGGTLVRASSPAAAITTLAFSLDGQTLASGHGTGEVGFWRVDMAGEAGNQASGAAEKVPWRRFGPPAGPGGGGPGHTLPVKGLLCIPGSTLLASAGLDGTVRLWDSSDGRPRGVLAGHLDWVNCLAVSPDGSLLASGGMDETVRLWSLPGGEPIQTMADLGSQVMALAICPDGRRIACKCKDGSFRTWPLDGSGPPAGFSGGPVYDDLLVFCPFRPLLLGADRDAVFHVWPFADGSSPDSVFEQKHETTQRCLASDWHCLVTGTMRGAIEIWALPWMQPLVLSGYRELAIVQFLLEQPSLPGPARAVLVWLEGLLRWKCRHEVIVEQTVFRTGDFDIELELR